MTPNQIATYLKNTNSEIYRQAENTLKPILTDVSLMRSIYDNAISYFSGEREAELLAISAVLKLYSPGFYHGVSASRGVITELTLILKLLYKADTCYRTSKTKAYMKNRVFASKVDTFIDLVKEGV